MGLHNYLSEQSNPSDLPDQASPQYCGVSSYLLLRFGGLGKSGKIRTC